MTTLVDEVEIKQLLKEEFVRSQLYEFAFFSIGRQGGRTALEILARALITEGKNVHFL